MLWGGNMGKNNKSTEQSKCNEIIINRMFSGGYLEDDDNIGHEIINLFESDEDNSYYIYLLSDGTYPKSRKNNKIQAIYLTEKVNANCLKVISIAKDIEPVFNPCKNWACAIGDDELKELSQVILNENNNELIDLPKELLDWIITDKFQNKKPFFDEQKEELQKVSEALYNLANKIERNKGTHNICKAIRYRAAHIEQLHYIIEHNVRYGGIRVNELFNNNASDRYGFAIYLTYKAKSVIIPDTPFYIANDKALNSIIENSKTIQIYRSKLATTSLATHFEEKTSNENNSIKSDYTILNDNYNVSGTEAKKFTCMDDSNDDFTFLSLIKKEYDELSFSNMFAYYFKKNNNILNGILSKSEKYSNINVSRPFLQTKVEINNPNTSQKEGTENGTNKNDQTKRITREEKNIDILIDDVQSSTVIVIENKIKSELNGRHSTDSILNQLDKYYDYTEKEYASYKNKVYLLLVPNYSRITEDSLVSEKQKKFDIIHYKDLYDILKENNIEDKYYDDFVNAVKFHSNDIDNHFEDIMKRKMQKLINESK